MNWADFTLIAIVLISVVISLFRGFAREFMALAIWVAAFWVAAHFSDQLDTLLVNQISLASARLAAAYVLLFVVTLLVGGIISYLIGKLVDGTGLTGTDRMLGMVFGVCRALVLITALILFLKLTPLTRDAWWHESVLLPRFERLADWSVQYFPDRLQSLLRDGGLETDTDSDAASDEPGERFRLSDFLGTDSSDEEEPVDPSDRSDPDTKTGSDSEQQAGETEQPDTGLPEA